MGREAQKKREEEGAVESKEAAEPQQEAAPIDPALLAMQHMNAFEDRRFLVQTVAVGRPDPNGMRELTFPISPLKQITLVLAPELVEHIVKECTGGIQVADLGDLEAVKRAAAEAEKAKS
jgi:hypothetical protein